MQSPTATSPQPSPIVPSSPGTASPSPQPTIPGDPFQKGIDKATSAKVLAQDGQTPEDWNLVITQWQRAIAFMKTVPRSSRTYASAQKLLPTYQAELARAQQIAKRGGRNPSSRIAKDNSKGGIPLIVSAGGTDADGATTIASLNQQQIDFFTRQKRFAANLPELNSSFPGNNPSYVYRTSGVGNNRAISTAIAKQDGLNSYIGAVFVVRDAKNNDRKNNNGKNNDGKNSPENNNETPDETIVAIACVTAQPSKTPPTIPQLQGKEARCPAGSSKL
ncbi:type IV pilin-like G/H family protein [Kovacikia minuta CCNUW1]|uniref:type IV pilin-like G/H family protein n=1 Tax=Kovacikia minuta TaxID=2931930 RepID=UPI001CCD27D5|nr:type IV pilin-like G/H family protein [Kovacikia minuta]UBF28157.1 type IV pilin-like G/H family protein [Kovacikia minuta CCNUW1]